MVNQMEVHKGEKSFKFKSKTASIFVGHDSLLFSARRLVDIQDRVLEYNNEYDKFASDAQTGKLNAEQIKIKAQELSKTKAQLDIDIANSLSKFQKGTKISEKSRKGAHK